MASQPLPFTCAQGLVLQVPAMHQVTEVSYGESSSIPTFRKLEETQQLKQERGGASVLHVSRGAHSLGYGWTEGKSRVAGDLQRGLGVPIWILRTQIWKRSQFHAWHWPVHCV